MLEKSAVHDVLATGSGILCPAGENGEDGEDGEGSTVEKVSTPRPRPVRRILSPEQERLVECVQGGKVVRMLRKTLHSMWETDGLDAIKPKELHGALPPTRFGPWAQEDAHDVLTFLLDEMLSVCNEEDDLCGNPLVQVKSKNCLSGVIAGKIASTRTCLSCQASQNVTEVFTSLMLPIPEHPDGGEDVSLDACLSGYLEPEVMDSVECEACQSTQACRRETVLEVVPDVLLVSLSRFDGYLRKRDALVAYPLEGWEVNGKVYTLVGVALHKGLFGGGHYTSMVRSLNNGQWYHLNDEYASLLSDPQDTVVSSDAYVLVYSLADQWTSAHDAINLASEGAVFEGVGSGIGNEQL